ncbi:CDGSH iron-sulfur domain-containing protein [Avrilella dinanensis]|nr:CDGSH iron-sulfur domain-containing protein [Avrilella dinanensis]
MDGYGLTDCVCGLSKRKPNCDGSHKQLENTNSSDSEF